MLKSIYIKNFAIVDELKINFKSGLNVFTGETGAGKSIIIGAISALLGEKFPSSTIRDGSDKAIIEGEFDIARLFKIKNYLEEIDCVAENDILILRREFNISGRSRTFVNDSPAKLEDIVAISDLLIDLHGQHDHQFLLKANSHLDFLDAYGRTSDLCTQVADSYKKAEKLRIELESLKSKQNKLTAQEEFIKFQLEEINAITPVEGEEEELLSEEKKLSNANTILEKINAISNAFSDDENSASSLISKNIPLLHSLEQIDPILTVYSGEANSALIMLEEIVHALQKYAGKIETDPRKLDEIRNRLADFSFLKKKYGPSIQDVIAKRNELAASLRNIESIDADVDALKKEWEHAIEVYLKNSLELSSERKNAGQQLEVALPQILSELGMAQTEFRVNIDKKVVNLSWLKYENSFIKPSVHGIDEVEFFIKTNPGQKLLPLIQIVSGGEVSRIMLALKSVVAHAVQIPVLLFDEIDSGISGRIAHAVGQKMKSLSTTHQIICITHLPQIAGAGEWHFLVKKDSSNDATTTTVQMLDQKEREQAIAQLLAGEMVTQSHLESAKELLK